MEVQSNLKENTMTATKSRILIYDIETMANLAYVWGKYEQNVIQYEHEWYMLCFAYKWLGEKTTHVVSLPDFKNFKKDKTDDSALALALWKLFDEADVVIAHNGNSFDQKKSQARFLVHGFAPPSPYKQIDTKLVAKRYFNFNSNKLDDLANILGIGRKVDTGGFDLWLGCASGDMPSWKKMCKYNKQDVVLLEKVYLKMRGWITNHPHVGVLLDDRDSCPNCGEHKLHKRGFGIRGNLTKIQRFQCQGCGTWTQKTIPKEKK